MAKLKGPLFSISASGSVGPRLTFSERRSGPQVRFQKAQPDGNTSGQQTERGFYTEAIAAWQTLNSGQRQQWIDYNAG